MANEHKFAPGPLDPRLNRVKRLSIYITTDGDHPANDLRFHIQGYTNEDENEGGGTLVPSGSTVDQLIDEFIDDDTLPIIGLERSPLDFSLQKECVVVLRLVGDFWQFSDTRDAITTKSKHVDSRYYGLRRHLKDGKVRGASFGSKKPLKQGNDGTYVRHGINLYIDFLQDSLRLPVTIDPDIENKGGNN